MLSCDNIGMLRTVFAKKVVFWWDPFGQLADHIKTVDTIITSAAPPARLVVLAAVFPNQLLAQRMHQLGKGWHTKRRMPADELAY